MLLVFDGSTVHCFSGDHAVHDVSACWCSCCDVACEHCAETHVCRHHRDLDGVIKTGGMCVARYTGAVDEDGLPVLERVRWFQNLPAYSWCSCPEQPDVPYMDHRCPTCEPFFAEVMQRLPGPPRKTPGAQRRALLAARQREKEKKASDPVVHPHKK